MWYIFAAAPANNLRPPPYAAQPVHLMPAGNPKRD